MHQGTYSSPLVKGFAPTRFIEGSREEAERLLGGRLPPLPAGELAEGEEIVYYVQHHPQLQRLAQAYLTHLFLEVCPEAAREGVKHAPSNAEQEYAGLLERTLVNSLMQDRRIGLVNLFWLSHSKEIRRHRGSPDRHDASAAAGQVRHPSSSGSLPSQRLAGRLPRGRAGSAGSSPIPPGPLHSRPLGRCHHRRSASVDPYQHRRGGLRCDPCQQQPLWNPRRRFSRKSTICSTNRSKLGC